MMDAKDITGLVLAGGRGLRMGGMDKGLQTLQGLPLGLHAVQRLQSSGAVGRVVINANRNLDTYAAFGVPVWPDALTDYPGPLAGFLTGLTHCQTPYLLTVPCDTPYFPLNLASRLANALQIGGADLALAVAPQPDVHGQWQMRTQPVFCLMRVGLLDSLRDYMLGGGRKVMEWTTHHKTSLACFDQTDDNPQAFFNANTLAELQQLEGNAA